MIKPVIIDVDLIKLIPADWNYKEAGEEEQIVKLINSIKRDNSYGVPAVREIKNRNRLLYEVIDGNHRLEALRRLAIKTVTVENFGRITKAQAVLIAKRRNTQWFKDDQLKYATLFRDIVFPEISIDEMVPFMPDTKEDIENISKLLDFDWDYFKKNALENIDETTHKVVRIILHNEFYAKWETFKSTCKEILKLEKEEDVFNFAIQEGLRKLKTKKVIIDND